MAVPLESLYLIGESRDQHGELLRRVAAAIVEESLSIIENGAETASRKTWAYRAVQAPLDTAETMLYPLLVKANESNLLDELPVAATDAQVRSTVAGLVDVYAEILAA